jgi:hypothetical protein
VVSADGALAGTVLWLARCSGWHGALAGTVLCCAVPRPWRHLWPPWAEQSSDDGPGGEQGSQEGERGGVAVDGSGLRAGVRRVMGQVARGGAEGDGV